MPPYRPMVRRFDDDGDSHLASRSDHVHEQETEERTATATGATTGTISDPVTDHVFVTVTSDDANKIIVLPAPTPGTIVDIKNGATGYELRSSDPATISINGGAEADAESAIAANTLVVCRCVSATAWICTSFATAGTVTATQVAAAA